MDFGPLLFSWEELEDNFRKVVPFVSVEDCCCRCQVEPAAGWSVSTQRTDHPDHPMKKTNSFNEFDACY